MLVKTSKKCTPQQYQMLVFLQLNLLKDTRDTTSLFKKKTNETIAAAAAGNDDHGDVNNIDEWTVRPAAVTQAKSRADIFEGIIRSSLVQFDSDNFSLTFDRCCSTYGYHSDPA